MSRLFRVVAVLFVLVTACSGSTQTMRTRSVDVQAVIVGEAGDDGRELKLLFVGGPQGVLEDDPSAGEYEAEVAESDNQITVTVHELALTDVADDVTCTAEGHGRELEVELDRPVGDRSVVDGHDDSPHWVIDPARVLWPQSLSDGWIVRSRDAGSGGLVSRYGSPTASDESITLEAGPIDADSGWTLDAALNASGTAARTMTVRGSANAVELTSDETGLVTIAFDEDDVHYRASAHGEAATEALGSFVAGLELDPTSRAFEIPFEAFIEPDPNEGIIVPTPTATLPAGEDAQTPAGMDPATEDPPTPTAAATAAAADGSEGDVAWSATESTRDVANYLEALRQGAHEEAAWPAINNGVAFDGQAADETAAEFLERACGTDLCQGPYLVEGEPGYIDPLTSQARATVSVTHVASGEETTMRLFTFEGQRMITSLPPLVAGENDASLRESLFGNAVPQRVVVERFDAFEIWDRSATEWVTNWRAENVVQVEGDVVSTRSGVFGLRDPQQEFLMDCPRLLERAGQVLVINQCVTDRWAVANAATGEQVDAPVPFAPAGETESAWFGERGGSVVTGTYDAEGNLVELRSVVGVDLLGDDYASLPTISTDGRHLAYVDHGDPAAFSHFWSPVIVVREVATGAEVGRWILDEAVSCLEYAVDWLVACVADEATLASGIPEQVALVAINPTTGDSNRVDTATRVFLPTN